MERKILLADSAELRRGLEDACFRRRDFRLLVARTGAEVLEIVERERPDLVFLGCGIADPDGEDCCQRIKSDPRLCAIPVVLVAPDGGEESLARCRRSGCDEVVPAPLNHQRLFALTRRLLHIVPRQSPRFEVRLRILYGAAQRDLRTGQTLNLGTGGVLLESDRLLPVETPVYVEILLPKAAEPIRCRARVAWVNPARRLRSPRLPDEMGLQFLDIRPEDKSAIRDYVEKEGLTPSL